ncbi:hypothetical protein Cni_G00307 [Canna indica]|uniref:Telomere-associated protein Rif1 N-terminal domain-containing protein n=1 Tax=Canna indica TaxID=4628 RepID=A0AAQ3JMG7_9LILI|nr:hypothetical protein Cni_G00307 [Canna indica]
MEPEARAFLLLSRQIEEIKTLPERSTAYVALLQLLRSGAPDHPPSVEALSRSSPSLLHLLLSDIHHCDEETAAYALRCLGFMLYHPSIVETIPEEVAILALESLVKLITTTKMKAICNLGVWCVSIQQISGLVVEPRLALILKAAIHALDNPFGSLSTTYEATQVLMKLSTQYGVEMRSMSNIWVPPLYRRLISNDKRERDMAERCLLKTKSIICPPTLILSTVVISDLKQKLLPNMWQMMDISQDYKQKVLIIQAWGWYICLLGSDALNDRHLVNKMLKVPERTFIHSDIQVQIATLFAWESFIDALLPPLMIECGLNIIHSMIQHRGPAPSSDEKIIGLLRRIKVLMTPLYSIILSKCDLSVRLRCLLTWRCLLHKLDVLVNHPSVIKTIFWQILEVILSRGPDDENLYLWNSCIDLLDQFLLAKVKVGETIVNSEEQSAFPAKQAISGSNTKTNALLLDHPIKWLPWNISDLDYHLNKVLSIIQPEQTKIMTSDQRCLTVDAALKIFRSILQGVQIEVKKFSDHRDKIQDYVTTLCKFRKLVCEATTLNHNGNQLKDFSWVHAQFTKVIRDELEPSLLSSYILD